MPTIDKKRIARTLGERIAEARENALKRGEDATQEDLAAELHVTQEAISAWENGRALPPLNQLVAICVFLGISLVALVTFLDPNPGTAKATRTAARRK